MYYIVDTEAPEGEFLELSEGPSKFEEIIELIPCEASPSDNANIFTDQGNPDASIPIYFGVIISCV